MYDELVKELRQLAKIYSICENENTNEYRLAMQAADAIEGLLAKDTNVPDKNVGKWIPVTERLPMIGEKAICFGKNGYMIGTYGEFGWMFPCYFGNVTHWMPLPEKPEEE